VEGVVVGGFEGEIVRVEGVDDENGDKGYGKAESE